MNDIIPTEQMPGYGTPGGQPIDNLILLAKMLLDVQLPQMSFIKAAIFSLH